MVVGVAGVDVGVPDGAEEELELVVEGALAFAVVLVELVEPEGLVVLVAGVVNCEAAPAPQPHKRRKNADPLKNNEIREMTLNSRLQVEARV